MKYLANNRLFVIAVVLAMCCMAAFAKGKVKVACIGNSITYGSGLEDPVADSYPSQLQEMLGDGYEVGRFGRPGATLLRHGHRPYNEQEECQAALDFKPDIAVIHLGINDTDPRNWPNYRDEFVSDYRQLIAALRQANPNVEIIIANLTPLRASHHRFKSGTRDWRLDIRKAIADVAKAEGLRLIDFDPGLRDRQDLLADGIHPNKEGYGVLAKTVYGALTGDWGGLRMPEIYQSGMVLQRDKYLTLRGTANTGSLVTVAIDGRSYPAKADGMGNWQVTIAPLSAGKTYEMTVTAGDEKLEFDNIAAGEVWLASGQSNMEFTLNQAIGGQEAIANSADPDLRFFDMKPIAVTNSKPWDSIAIAKTNRLEYYKPSRWEVASPENAEHWSAVAYFFAKELRDSLGVPVGIISNAIGGSTTESWIDVNTLEAEIPEILVNWQGNDYVMKWAQRRAQENVGQQPGARHPYEPSYLFSAGIRPLGQYPVAGAIWYQGESNAHNIEIHERLFPLLVDSWRRNFGDPDMPFIFAQLSSIDRPSWPHFRDSQRRLAQAIPGVGMAVTSDYGDSLDVHPRHKAPVGHRMALAALHDRYGRCGLEHSGPSPVSAAREGDAIVLTMDHAQGMGAEGAPVGFEIAEIDGVYYPAEAEIAGNKIYLKNMNVKKPKYARYAWQPFTRANLVNGAGLPASTFKVEIENPDLECEPGIECGVSACFAGELDGKIVMAGGCNFPGDPFAPGATKKFYKGVYQFDPESGLWTLIGELPQPMAYGAYCTVGDKIILIGGAGADGSFNTVYALGAGGIEALPSLPCAIDNAYAAAIGRNVYVAGGNCDGEPSRSLFTLDLDNLDKGWRKLRDMPGNPRVQPVMAAARNAKGEECLFLWGGFAGKGAKREASLELDGLCYSPSANKWTPLPGFKDANGEAISLGGGVACALPSGRILAAGGVNKDVFLEALRNQAPDYLSHPIEWYRFNDAVAVFDPQTMEWTILDRNSDAARAGAAAVAKANGAGGADAYLIGGELKPRVRTSITSVITAVD